MYSVLAGALALLAILLAWPVPQALAGARWVTRAPRMAVCLWQTIGLAGGVSAIAALPPDELAALLAHERAHAQGRHELVIQPFVAWQTALPFLAPARRATAAVADLVELLADDAAAEATSRMAVARALARVGGQVPTIALLYDDELLPVVPTEAHDQRVRLVARPGPGLTRLPAPASGRTAE